MKRPGHFCDVDNPDVSDEELGAILLRDALIVRKADDGAEYIEGAPFDLTADSSDEDFAMVFGERGAEVKARLQQNKDYDRNFTVKVTKVSP